MRNNRSRSVGVLKPERPTKAETRIGDSLAVILRDVPGGYNWGWYSREDSRMHLQTVDDVHRNLYKVWLEKKGTRTFEPAGTIPAKVLKKLQSEIARLR